jgi:hypothetical protein
MLTITKSKENHCNDLCAFSLCDGNILLAGIKYAWSDINWKLKLHITIIKNMASYCV